MRKKYFALRVIAGVFKVLAWISFIIGFVAFVFTLAAGGMFFRTMGTFVGYSHVPMAFLNLFIGFLVFLVWYAFAEGISVFLDIEENTRRSAEQATKQP